MPIETAARLVYPDEDAVGRPMYYGDVPAPGIARRAPIAMELPGHARVQSFSVCAPDTRK